MAKYFSEYTGKTSNNKYKIECWHPTKNDGINPNNIIYDDETFYWFKCDDCNTDINLQINKITADDEWCKYCSSPCYILHYILHSICDLISIF
jgi:hypothetical protein